MRLRYHILTLVLLLGIASSPDAQSADTLKYTLLYQKGDQMVQIILDVQSLNQSDLTVVIPRSAPGTYEITDYIQFVKAPLAIDMNGAVVHGERGDGSYYVFSSVLPIRTITYSVDLEEMEHTLLGAFASSRVRDRYLGLLGYSVFGVIEEFTDVPIDLTFNVDNSWPVFSTLKPGVPMRTGTSRYTATSFAELADAQYLAGPDLQIWFNGDGPTPFYLSMYSESPLADRQYIGKIGLDMLNQLHDYFGFTPMPHYVMHLEYLVPVSDQHSYGFWMEHMNSMTGFSDTSQILTPSNSNKLLSIMHHMGHSWIPLRCYGEGYRPFVWSVAPLIETIWFNEGFIWYAAGVEILQFERLLPFFKRTVEGAPDFIQALSLRQLSLLGSTQYSSDFRIGRNLFSRGALFAHDLNLFVLKQSNGKKGFKDVILAIYKWSEDNNRAFTYEEFPAIISRGIGIDIHEIWDKWQ